VAATAALESGACGAIEASVSAVMLVAASAINFDGGLHVSFFLFAAA
jgi:hypothetical protein